MNGWAGGGLPDAGYLLLLPLSRSCVPESLGERVIVDFQLSYLQKDSGAVHQRHRHLARN